MAETKTTKEMAEPKEKLVKIMISSERDDESDVFISINERTWLIQRDVEVEVPECVAKQLAHMRREIKAARDFKSGTRTDKNDKSK